MKTIALLTCILLVLSNSQAQNESFFQFIESSSGMNYPSWEGGDTELEFADINLDGFVDILTIGDHGSPLIGSGEHGIMVYFGDGTGTWSVEMTGDFGYGGIAIGDVNNDGLWDVGYGMHHDYSSTDFGDQLLEVALGDGTGTGWTPWDDGLATNGENWGLFGTDFADVDNDGDLDIGANSFGSGSGLHVYLNQGDGSWVQSFGILPGNSNNQFVFGDINKDGNADFALNHDAGMVFFGEGDGSFFNAGYNLPQMSFPASGIDLGDVDNDGGDDIAFINAGGGIRVYVFEEEATQWQNVSGDLPSSGDYQQVQLCDFNSDGTMDLAAFGEATLTVWRGTTLGTSKSIIWTQEFNTITSNNGDCAAFRAGGDVDRNGYPDITLVESVGSWPSDYNKIKCFRESSPLFFHRIKAVFPKGEEVFKQGSVQFIDWISAIPQSSASPVKIEYSLRGASGPFNLLTPGTANSGRYQWIVPQTISTNNSYIRYSLVEGDDTLTAMTPGPFVILGEYGIDADFVADSTLVEVNTPVNFTDRSLGLITTWQWDFDNNDTIDATVRNPVHTYAEPGEYTVKLSVSDGTSNATEIKTRYISVWSTVKVDEEKSLAPEVLFYPNPFIDRSVISYRLSEPGLTSLRILDQRGTEMIILMNQLQPAGNHRLPFDATSIPAGTYIYELRSGNSVVSGKVIKLNR